MAGWSIFVVYFLVTPVISFSGAALWLWLAMRRAATNEVKFLRDSSVNRRYVAYLLIFATSIAFGANLLLLSLSAMQRTNFLFPYVVHAVGWAFAGTVIVTTLSEAAIVVRRTPGAYRTEFGPTMILAIIPHSAVLFAVIFGLEAINIYGSRPLMPALFGPDIGALLVLLGSTGAPLIARLTNAVPTLDLASLRRALRRSWIGSAIILACFAGAIFFISR